MKKNWEFHMSSKFLFLPILILFMTFTSCEDSISSEEAIQSTKLKASNSSEKSNDFYGPSQPLGNGVIRSVVTVGHDGVPQAVGIEFSSKALENLPTEEGEHNIHLALSNKAEGLIVDHIDVGWNPNGHEPAFYSVPHFDIHFYWISLEEQMNILNPGLAEELPGDEYRPETYFFTDGYVPMMGKHWLSYTANELNGKDFDQTFIYGSYDSEFIFYEPMITRAYLLAKDFQDQYVIYQPDFYQRSGYYAMNYEISYDATKKVYRVMLSNLFWENGNENL